MAKQKVTLRELDALVAEKVLGWTEVRQHFWKTRMDQYRGALYWIGCPPGACSGSKVHVPRCSTDIAKAWEVVEEVCAAEEYPQLEWGRWGSTRDQWRAHMGGGYYWAESAPLAICLAALAAKGIEVELAD